VSLTPVLPNPAPPARKQIITEAFFFYIAGFKFYKNWLEIPVLNLKH